jgi:hypothetical protein
VSAHAEFAGGRAGIGPLNWGQRGVWKAIEDLAPDDHWLNLRAVLDAPRSRAVDVPTALAAIGRLVERHESLRTRIRQREGELRQVVAAAGRNPVVVVPVLESGPPAGPLAGPAGSPAEPAAGPDLAAALADRLAATPFDYADEWPLRVGLVVAGEAVRHVVLVISHAVADRHAVDVVARDLRLLLLRGSVPTPPGPQPLDLAERQRTDDRHTAAALAYWAEQYARLPAVGLPYVAAPAEPRYRNAMLTSPALAAAARIVAARNRVGTGTVVLSAALALLHRRSAGGVVGMLTMVSNRHRAEHRALVSSMSQLALLAVDLPDPFDFDRLVGSTWQAALRGYRHAYYDQAVLDRVLTELGRVRGTRIDPECCFNDIRAVGDDPGAGTPDGAAVHEALGETRLNWETMDRFNWRCYVELRDAPGGLCLALAADTRCLPPPDMERFLRDLEGLVVHAARREADAASIAITEGRRPGERGYGGPQHPRPG